MNRIQSLIGQVLPRVLCVLMFVTMAGTVNAQNDWTGPAGVEGNWTNELYWGGNPPPVTYALIRNGGIAVIDTAGVVCDRPSIGSSDGTDTLRVNTNGDLTAGTDIRLGGGNVGDTGTLEVNGGEVTLPGSADLLVTLNAGTTGIVSVTEGKLSVGKLLMSVNWHPATGSAHGGISRFYHSGGDVLLGALQTHFIGGGAVGERDAAYIQTGGMLTSSNIIYIGNDAGSTGLYSISNAVMETSRTIVVGNAGMGRMEIHDGASVTVSNDNRNLSDFDIGYSGGTGTVEMTGGILKVQCLDMASGNGTAVFRLKGGTLKFMDYRFNLVSSAGGDGLFEQTGGLLDLTTTGILYLSPAAGATARYNISGGTIDSANVINIAANPDVGAFRLTGSAPSVTFRYIRNDGDTPFLLEFVLDKSLDHLAPINLTFTSAFRTGDLRVGLDGGIVLTQTNSFAVIRAAGLVTSKDYTSRPDPDMWTEALVYNVDGGTDDESRITLADGYKQADLNMNGTKTASFAARPMGHVTLANISTNRLISLVVNMDVTEGDKSVSELVADMVAAGYTNSVVKDIPPYDMQLHIPVDFVVDKSVDALSYFAWDFTDPTTLATNATVTAISFETLQHPAQGTLILIQ